MRWARHIAHTGEVKMITEFLSGNLVGRNHLGYVGINGRIILNVKKIGCKCMDWIHQIQDGDQWQALEREIS
jgi:hypothetical protein